MFRPAYVLAGGKSSRFGSDKARATLHAVPLIVGVADMLRSSCREVVVVADVSAKYADLKLETIPDRRPGLGPLAGVEAALTDHSERFGPGWAIVASCDLVGLKRAWIETVAAHLPSAEEEKHGAVAFRSEFWQPFPAAYHTDLLPLALELLDGGKASFQRLLSDSRSNTLALPLPSDWPEVVQANTPEELDRFKI